jgi:hypothetical protein
MDGQTLLKKSTMIKKKENTEFKASQLQNPPSDMQSLARIEVVSDTGLNRALLFSDYVPQCNCRKI